MPVHTAVMDNDDIDDIDDMINTTIDVVNDMLDDTSEEEQRRGRGSRKGKKPNVDRNHSEVAARLNRQYLSETPSFDGEIFRRRYRVSRAIYDRIVASLVAEDRYFIQKKNCCGKEGISPHVKVTAALRIMAYGLPPDAIDDYLEMSESTARETIKRFCAAVVASLGPIYLREPTDADIKKMLSKSAARGTPGLLGSIDCTKWAWKNCPTAWHGQFKGKEKVPAVTLEAICDRSLWIWHAFFGMPGALNDINVVAASTILNKIAAGTFPPPCEYRIAGVRRNKPYWFCDGIYPRAPFFISSISEPVTMKEKLYASIQEAVRKDIERAFGVLQSKWNIICRPSKFMTVDIMKDVMKCAIIMHNMCVEERDMLGTDYGMGDGEDSTDIMVGGGVSPMWCGLVRQDGCFSPPGSSSLAALCEARQFMEDESEHSCTKKLLMQHMWELYGDQ